MTRMTEFRDWSTGVSRTAIGPAVPSSERCESSRPEQRWLQSGEATQSGMVEHDAKALLAVPSVSSRVQEACSLATANAKSASRTKELTLIVVSTDVMIHHHYLSQSWARHRREANF